ncbi:hypothetical protein SFC79_08385 [Nocardioides sp. S-58]|uniref:Mce-associated membrane protein n=1 Tax=Nocardioides renjunii TaxID=3095075 RepID=A0ABU5KAA1_9ACTN|nr:hypothetical protein [Nocardioides sp. S-58]MDZ5661777.1 hypothetical protein [Nocardioides sp. S-58]
MDPRRLLPVLAALASACVAATLVVSLGRAGEGAPRGGKSPAAQVTQAAGAVTDGPSAVLAHWDARRAEAWAAADAKALAELYVAGSRSGAADVRLLRDYRERGLTVEGLTTQLLAVEVVERTPDRLVLVVTDRVSGGRVVGADTDVALPADRASTRRVVLVRDHAGGGAAWLVAEASARGGAQDRAAARTSRTSSSSKS